MSPIQDIRKEDLITYSDKTEWGIIYYYYGENFRFALYLYDDDKDTIYLANLDVYKNSQHQGIGNKVLNFAIEESIRFKVKSILLKCLKTSWVYEWYLRHGFKYHSLDKDSRYVWLEYIIK